MLLSLYNPLKSSKPNFEDFTNSISYGKPNYCLTIQQEKLMFYMNYTHYEAQEIFNILKNCKCCNVHNIRKPETYDSNYTFISYKDNQERISNSILDLNNNKVDIICKCPCRHNMRIICNNYCKY